MSFEQALNKGDLDVARAILDELVDLPDTGGLWMPECYADLAREYDRQTRHDDAIALLERAIELGWGGRPHPRSDIAEFHLRAGRHDEAAAIWAELKASDPDEVWLYNAAGLSYNEIGEHELAVEWLGEGIELAMRTDDPEGIINQLSHVRRQSLDALPRSLRRTSVLASRRTRGRTSATGGLTPHRLRGAKRLRASPRLELH